MKMKGFGSMATVIAGLEFMETYDFHNFKTEKGLGIKMEAFIQKGGTVEAAASSLNAEGTWDQKEYGSLSDIKAGEDVKKIDFIAKLVREKETEDDMKSVEFIDEEGTTKTIKVHETHHDLLSPNYFYVVHRAKILDEQCVVDGWAMLSIASQAYTWE